MAAASGRDGEGLGFVGSLEVGCWGSVQTSPSTRRNEKKGRPFLLKCNHIHLVWLGFKALIGRLLSGLSKFCNALLFSLRQPLTFHCNPTNMTYADPSKMKRRWSLSREMHCGAVFPHPVIRSRSASWADRRGGSRRLGRIRTNSRWPELAKGLQCL